MRWVVVTCEMYGLVIGVREVGSGRLLAVCGVLPPSGLYAAQTDSFLKGHMFAIASRVGMLPPDIARPSKFPGVTARMDNVNDGTTYFLNTCADSWLVHLVAASPDAGGKGCTRSMLEAVAAIAAPIGLPCRLEAGSEKNEQVYGRLGYSTYERKTMRAEDGEEVGLRFMVQRPAAAVDVRVAADTVRLSAHFAPSSASSDNATYGVRTHVSELRITTKKY
jgi:hypothetical protein